MTYSFVVVEFVWHWYVCWFDSMAIVLQCLAGVCRHLV